NVVTGEILEALSATKTAVTGDYTRNDDVTYVISAVNSGAAPLTGVSVSDDLGGYAYGAETLYPLTYVENSAHLYINGVLQAPPAVTQGPPLVFSGITIPANGNMILIYEAEVNQFAPLGSEDSIVNTATVTAAGIPAPILASETVTPEAEPNLTISKSIEPATVTENGNLTYRFIIQNHGNTAAGVDANVVLSDTFDPILYALNVTFNGSTWTEGVNYNYIQADGTFTTLPGQITVPAATYTQDAETGTWVITPGVSTLVVGGTIQAV
ncbi:MAG: hypothetical protein IJX13_07200, partial [Clostridia bacterium]|nr:hypothetical protein [Clostridia bacterium]